MAAWIEAPRLVGKRPQILIESQKPRLAERRLPAYDDGEITTRHHGATDTFICDKPAPMMPLRGNSSLPMKGRATAVSDHHFELKECTSSTH